LFVSTSNPAGRLCRSEHFHREESTVADRTSLELLGFIFGGVTAVVIVIAAMVVRSHVDAQAALQAGAPVIPAALSASARR
jgi:hypothetical protein